MPIVLGSETSSCDLVGSRLCLLLGLLSYFARPGIDYRFHESRQWDSEKHARQPPNAAKYEHCGDYCNRVQVHGLGKNNRDEHVTLEQLKNAVGNGRRWWPPRAPAHVPWHESDVPLLGMREECNGLDAIHIELFKCRGVPMGVPVQTA